MRPTLSVLEPALVDRIIDEALGVLATTGVMIDDERALKRLAGAGLEADLETGRVRFPRASVERALATAPSSVTLHDRDGEVSAVLEGDRVHFVPASSALRVLDRRTQKARVPLTPDFVEYVRLADGLKNISYLSTAFIPTDIPQDVADVWRLYLVLAHSQRPVVSGAFTAWGVPRMGRVMAMFRDDREDLVRRPMSIFTCCPNTPLRWGADPVANIMDCAEWGIPIEIVPVLLLGMISPVTTVGALVLHTAEVLSGLVIAQVVRPGTPVIFGGAPASFHMQLMTNPMTAVEALQLYCGYAQVAKRLGLPCQAYMALSDSKFNDPQAGMETGVGAFLAASAGFNSVSGPGMLDYVNCFSFEKLVFDDEIVAHAQRFIRPVEVREDLPAGELIAELVRDNHLLTSEHTLAHWPEELYMPGPTLDRTNWDQWAEQGSRDWRARANEVIDETLAAYEVEPLEQRVHDEIRQLISSTSSDPGAVLPAFTESPND
ncbi:MAG: trimethylamine methyltransferase family protein [Steroidobacteraceae bacterium]|nr:trimethylamine methyltransferase family protein [Steroidobacteraceae bacterium]